MDMKRQRTRIDGKHKQRMATLRQRLTRARRLVRSLVPRTVSLVEELVAERRKEAQLEYDQH
jgi:hypothetical protein